MITEFQVEMRMSPGIGVYVSANLRYLSRQQSCLEKSSNLCVKIHRGKEENYKNYGQLRPSGILSSLSGQCSCTSIVGKPLRSTARLEPLAARCLTIVICLRVSVTAQYGIRSDEDDEDSGYDSVTHAAVLFRGLASALMGFQQVWFFKDYDKLSWSIAENSDLDRKVQTNGDKLFHKLWERRQLQQFNYQKLHADIFCRPCEYGFMSVSTMLLETLCCSRGTTQWTLPCNSLATR